MRYLAGVDTLFPDTPSGSARVAWDIALAMSRLGHEVTLAAVRRDPQLPLGVDEIDGVRIVRYQKSDSHPLHPRRYKNDIESGVKQLGDYLAGESFDCLHLHIPLTGSVVYQAFPDTTRVVYTMHSPAITEMRIVWGQQGLKGKLKQIVAEGPLRKLEHTLLKRADAIHTLSQFTKGHVDKDYGLAGKVTVIPHWCRDGERRTVTKQEARKRLGWPEDPPIMFTVRRHVYRMGLDIAIEAVAPLAAKGECIFYVGGDGPLRQELQSRARHLGASETGVAFTGRLSEKDLSLAYQAADLFLLPTRALECFGLIVIEAMGYGCPVLGTSAGAIPELVEPISPKLLVPPEDIQSLRQSIQDWLVGQHELPSDNELSSYIDQRYSADAIIPLFQNLLSGGSSINGQA